MRVPGAFGDDVDDAVHRVRAPDGAARTANHLDAIDVFEHHVVESPQDAGEQRRVNVATVDEDEHAFGELIAKAANADGPVTPAVDAGYFHARCETQRVRN